MNLGTQAFISLFRVRTWVVFTGCSVLLCAVFVLSSNAHASRAGRVVSDQTSVYLGPSGDTKVIIRLKRGTTVRASNFPTDEFYKVRVTDAASPQNVRGKVLGFIQSEDLSLEPLASGVVPNVNRKTKKSEQTPIFGEKRRASEGVNHIPGFRLQGLGDLNLYRASGVVIGFDNVTQGYSVGGEMLFRISASSAFALRVDYIFQNVALNDSSSGLDYAVGFAGLPMMGGFDFGLLTGSVFRFHVGFFGGYAITTVGASQAGGAETLASAGGLTGLARAQIDWSLTKVFSLVIEGGYRYLQSAQASNPSPLTGGGAILNSSFAVNFSGPIVGVGLCFSL